MGLYNLSLSTGERDAGHGQVASDPGADGAGEEEEGGRGTVVYPSSHTREEEEGGRGTVLYPHHTQERKRKEEEVR